MISPDIIERIRDRASIAEIIGESVKLERRGRSLVGLCPFHQEKTGSFHVNEERGRFHCFGCQASGDVFSFIQETEGLSFLEAVRRLGERFGVEVVDDMSDDERRQRAAAKRREQALFDVNAAAASFFERMLREHPEAHFATDELTQRELPVDGPAEPVLRAFRVGYAPHGWDGLVSYLRKAGLDLRAAEAVGLIGAKRGGSGHYDRFRHRLMFAVLDLQGRVVAFSGRALPPPRAEDDESPAKYYNSPESPIYSKRQTVFGLFQARTALRHGDPCLLVEGNFDVVSLHARGFPAAVAPLGTAFTEEQGRQIRRFTQDVVLLFDGDRAGREATSKSREPAKTAGLQTRVARLPDGMDPDDFSRQRGPKALSRLLDASTGILDHLISELLDEAFASADATSQGQKIQRVLRLLESEDDPNVRALAEQRADQLASRLNVADARTFEALRRSIQRSLRAPTTSRQEVGQPSDPQEASRRETPADRVTHALVGALLDFPDLLDSSELMTYANDMQGDLAAVVACLRLRQRRSSAAATPHSGCHAMHIAPLTDQDLRQALAYMPATVRPFAEARLAAPLHADLEIARAEFLDNLKKLKNVELTKQASTTLGELERARSEGDTVQEDVLLRQQEERARKRRGMK